ncbi:MAG: GntR family transcriptional regulator [Flavobacteriaceae bacterium]|nr:GntR family transcriptional regulator [Flavobacteriaceae bacterium]
MIERKSLRSQIIDALWQMIIDAKIEPNAPLREIHLAEHLQVSRTPLRAALQKLEWEGIVVSDPGKGFRLAPLTVKEVREIYPLRAQLESFGLELSGIPSDKTIAQLEAINTKMEQCRSARKLVALDEQWHKLLIVNCNNDRLLAMVKVLHRQSQRYEYAYMDLENTAAKSIAQHKEIIHYLKTDRLADACRTFAENNRVGIESLISWLQTTHQYA